jgi:hypothetical protein
MLPTLRILVVLAGIGQLVLIVASLAIPRMLGWKEDVAKLRSLTRQVFWTYAGYIWATNLSFGLLSTFGSRWLLDGTPLAAAVAGYIPAYWAARVGIQFFYFDRSDASLADAPGAKLYGGKLMRLGEGALVLLFLSLTLIYGAVMVRNIWS